MTTTNQKLSTTLKDMGFTRGFSPHEKSTFTKDIDTVSSDFGLITSCRLTVTIKNDFWTGKNAWVVDSVKIETSGLDNNTKDGLFKRVVASATLNEEAMLHLANTLQRLEELR